MLNWICFALALVAAAICEIFVGKEDRHDD